MLNLSKCITKHQNKPFPETMLVSTLKTSLLKILEEEMFALIQRMTQQLKLNTSQLKSSFLTILDKSKTVIAQSWIAILAILLLNSKKFNHQLTEELVKFWKNSQNSLNQDKLAWLKWYQPNPCVLKSSLNIHHLEDSPSET